MRKITEDSTRAFHSRQSFGRSNSQVMVGERFTYFSLFGKQIARYDSNCDELRLRDSGYQTVTTKDRLNGLLDTFDTGLRIFQKDYCWYIWNHREDITHNWQGELTIMSPYHNMVAMFPLDKKQSEALAIGQTIYVIGHFERWRINGQTKTWKRSPERFQIPIKHGLWDYDYLTDDNCHLLSISIWGGVMAYINIRQGDNRETIDEYNEHDICSYRVMRRQYKAKYGHYGHYWPLCYGRYLLVEHRMAYHGSGYHIYISQRACANWRKTGA